MWIQFPSSSQMCPNKVTTDVFNHINMEILNSFEECILCLIIFVNLFFEKFVRTYILLHGFILGLMHTASINGQFSNMNIITYYLLVLQHNSNNKQKMLTILKGNSTRQLEWNLLAVKEECHNICWINNG